MEKKMAQIPKSKEELISVITQNSDIVAQHTWFFRFIQHLLETKYSKKDFLVTNDHYALGSKVNFYVVNKSPQEEGVHTVVEEFADENAWDVEITAKEGDDFIIAKPEALDRIWTLYEEVYPKEVIEKQNVKALNNQQDIPIDLIDRNPEQIRVNFDDVEVLAESIKRQGLLVPIHVAKNDDRYTLLDGERRVRAYKMLEWDNIPAFVHDKSDADFETLGLVFNFQRSNPNFISLAKKVAEIRQQIKKTNTWGKNKNIIPLSDIYSLDYDSPTSSCKEIDEVIIFELGLTRKILRNLNNILKLPEEIRNQLGTGQLVNEEGIIYVNLDTEDFGEEFTKVWKSALERERVIQRIEKKAKDANNPNAKLLRYFKPIEKLNFVMKNKVDEYWSLADEQTRVAVKERAKDIIKILSEKFGINLEELKNEEA